MAKLKLLSLFSGIGAPEKALERMNIDYDLVGFSEIDKYAARSYCAIHHVDQSLNLGDVTKIDEESLKNFDLLVGGFPCQSFSVAGNQRGFEDARGTLFFDLARIAKHKQPKIIFCENVKGLVNHDRGNTVRVIIQTLCDIGYTVDFNLLNAKYFGVPQNRERIYIFAIRNDRIQSEPWVISGNNMVSKRKRELMVLDSIRTFNFCWPEEEKVTKKLRDVLESEVDKKFYLSEDKVSRLVFEMNRSNNSSNPLIVANLNHYKNDQMNRVYSPEFVGPTVLTHSGGGRDEKIAVKSIGNVNPSGRGINGAVYDSNGLSPTITTNKGEGAKIMEGIEFDRKSGIGKPLNIAHTLSSSDWRGLNRNQKQTAVLEEFQPVLTHSGEGRNKIILGARKQVAALTERRSEDAKKIRREFQKKYGRDFSPRRGKIVDTRKDEMANCVTATQGIEQKLIEVRPVLTPDRLEKRQNGRRFKENDEPAFTVNTQDRHGVAFGYENYYRIRKLTPLECWRLMGFDDEDFKEAASVCSNSQLYKQAGNSIVVNVLTSLFKVLLTTIEL